MSTEAKDWDGLTVPELTRIPPANTSASSFPYPIGNLHFDFARACANPNTAMSNHALEHGLTDRMPELVEFIEEINQDFKRAGLDEIYTEERLTPSLSLKAGKNSLGAPLSSQKASVVFHGYNFDPAEPAATARVEVEATPGEDFFKYKVFDWSQNESGHINADHDSGYQGTAHSFENILRGIWVEAIGSLTYADAQVLHNYYYKGLGPRPL